MPDARDRADRGQHPAAPPTRTLPNHRKPPRHPLAKRLLEQGPRSLDPLQPVQVAAVIPCFNRPQDLALLLQDLARQDLRGIDLWVVVVDNASPDPLQPRVPVPPGLRVEFVRNSKNAGGSGGFNLGMSRVLSGSGLTGRLSTRDGGPEFMWWLDSDARVAATALRHLVRALLARPDLGAVGSALCDQVTGTTWEIGGTVIKEHGTIVVSARGDVDRRKLVRTHYVAACSALVRTDVARVIGTFPDSFIYYDDVIWCVQMRRLTGLRSAAVPRSRAFHPPSNARFATWTRYYMARNCYTHIDLMKLGGLARFRRALFEAFRVASQNVMGLDELGEIRLRGLRDALAGDFTPYEPKSILPTPLGMRPLRTLPDVLRELNAGPGQPRSLYVHPIFKRRLVGWEPLARELDALSVPWPRNTKAWKHRSLASHARRDLLGAAWRALVGPSAHVAIVPTGWPSGWFRGRTLVMPTSEGLLVRQVHGLRTTTRTLTALAKAIALAARIGLKAPPLQQLQPAPAWNPQTTPPTTQAPDSGARPASQPAHTPAHPEPLACSPSSS